MSRKSEKSFVGLPNAILFPRISPERVFQQPQTITLIATCSCLSNVFVQLLTKGFGTFRACF